MKSFFTRPFLSLFFFLILLHRKCRETLSHLVEKLTRNEFLEIVRQVSFNFVRRNLLFLRRDAEGGRDGSSEKKKPSSTENNYLDLRRYSHRCKSPSFKVSYFTSSKGFGSEYLT